MPGGQATARRHVAIVAHELPRALAHAISLHDSFDTTVVHSAAPVFAARVMTADILIVDLSQDDSVVDVRALIDAVPHTSILVLAERLPLRHAIAHCIVACHHAVLAASESQVVVHATIVALLAGRAVNGAPA